nr:FMRFamide receptor isoform X2 [Onthophagus taurus]
MENLTVTMNSTDLDIEQSIRFVESSRFWIQRVLVPILVFIGVGGNIVTVMVLTRRRMRCTTTIYLTALAIADVIYLIFVLLLSLTHYPNIHNEKYMLYWRFYGISHWLCDAASSTSVWLTVSFTVERYIVVCHPIKGKVLCTETRAKNIITIISLLCLLATISTTFEYQLDMKKKCINENRCQNEIENNLTDDKINSTILSNFTNIENIQDNHQNQSNLLFIDNLFLIDQNKTLPKNSKDCVCQKENDELTENHSNETDTENITESLCFNSTCGKLVYTIYTVPTSLAENDTYITIMYWFSSLTFGILPLILIATFNCFLIRALYISQVTRKKMTKNQESVTQTQENRITLLLISVVILFLICQTPTATFLIYDSIARTSDPYTNNIKRGLGNIFNLLLAVNASCNFILYCVLSDKYRRTFKAMFCERKLNRSETLVMSRSTNSTRFNMHSNGFQRCKTQYGNTPRTLETQSLTSIPRSKSLMVRSIGNAKSSDLVV